MTRHLLMGFCALLIRMPCAWAESVTVWDTPQIISDDAPFRCDVPVEKRNWLAWRTLVLSIRSARPTTLRVGITGIDTELFRCATRWELPADQTIPVRVDLLGSWEAVGHGGVWNTYATHYVRQLQLEILGNEAATVVLEAVSLEGTRQLTTPAKLLKLSPGSPRQGQELTLHFTAELAVANPYETSTAPYVVLHPPTGGAERLSAFFYRDYELQHVEGRETAIPTGPYHWAARVFLRDAGSYRWEFFTGSGTPTPLSGAFQVSPAQTPGFLRLTKRGTGGFEYEDGTFFYPIGLNACWPSDPYKGMVTGDRLPDDHELSVYDEWFRRMHENGINTTQIWMTPFWTALEWSAIHDGYGGIGVYSPRAAWKLDYLLNLARKHGIHLVLTMRNHQQFFGKPDGEKRAEWAGNPWGSHNGGPLDSPGQWFTDKAAIQGNTNYLRYCAARWGQNPQIICYIAMSETDNAIAGGISESEEVTSHSHPAEKPILPAAQQIMDWYDGCLAEANDFHGRPLLIGNCRQFQLIAGQVYHHETLPVALTDFYIYRRDSAFTPAQGMHIAYNHLHRTPKLYWVTETGFSGAGELPHEMAPAIHETYWASSMLPMVGTAMYWWWNSVFEEDLLYLIRPVAAFWKGEDRRKARLRHLCGVITGQIERLSPSGERNDQYGGNFRQLLLYSSDHTYGFVHPLTDEVYYEAGKRVAHNVLIELARTKMKNELVAEFWDTRKGTILERRLVPAGTKELVAPDFHDTVAFKLHTRQPDEVVELIEGPTLSPKPAVTTLTRQVQTMEVEPPESAEAALAMNLGDGPKSQFCSWRQVNDQFNPWRTDWKKGGFVSTYNGQLQCPAEGTYTFATDSDDASFLWIDGQLVVAWPGAHDPTLPNDRQASEWEHTGTVQLTAGSHAFKYLMINGKGASLARAAWQPPGQAEIEVIPAAAFIPAKHRN